MLEEAAETGHIIADLAPPSCDQDGKFEARQFGMGGGYCVDKETGKPTQDTSEDCSAAGLLRFGMAAVSCLLLLKF